MIQDHPLFVTLTLPQAWQGQMRISRAFWSNHLCEVIHFPLSVVGNGQRDHI